MLDLRRQDFIALLGVFLDGTPIGRKCSRFANLARISVLIDNGRPPTRHIQQ